MNIPKPTKSIEDLIREQGVKPGALDSWLASPWSDEEDEEVDALIAMRRERRAWELAQHESPVTTK